MLLRGSRQLSRFRRSLCGSGRSNWGLGSLKILRPVLIIDRLDFGATKGFSSVSNRMAPVSKGHMLFDESLFDTTLDIVGLKVGKKDCHGAVRKCKNYIMHKRNVKNVVFCDREDDKRIVLIDDEKFKTLDDVKHVQNLADLAKEFHGEFIMYKLQLGYRHLSMNECLRKLLPDHITELPSAYEAAGHIAHLNLRSELLPYKEIIGRVLLDKNPSLKTVVNKTGNIATEFRTFPLEVIAGIDDMNVEMKQGNARFRFNFAKVYWNSRLDSEHGRLVKRFSKGDTVVDGFCGVGPFAIPAAMKGCTVYANDLNPESYAALLNNIELNKVGEKVSPSNDCARAYIRRKLMEDKIVAHHFVMNLPATSIEFLDAFVGSFPEDVYARSAGVVQGEECGKRRDVAKAPLPMIHCYCFSTAKDYSTDVRERCEAVLGVPIDPSKIEVREVRDVAPKKLMLCAHFQVPEAAAFSDVVSKKTKL